jgi:hypothetical protein
LKQVAAGDLNAWSKKNHYFRENEDEGTADSMFKNGISLGNDNTHS